MTNEQGLLKQAATTVTQEIVKPLYDDAIHPVAKYTGDTLGLMPRVIKAALLPLEKWILHREYNLAETEKLLAHKLENTTPENIVPPEPYIAIPALQQISYCMDSEELRNMYANLLARAMNKDTKNDVHPSFAEIIKNLSPDEAILLKYVCTYFSNLRSVVIPTISLHRKHSPVEYEVVISKFSDFPEMAGCQQQPYAKQYFDNLERLKIIEFNTAMLADNTCYVRLMQNEFIRNIKDDYRKNNDKNVVYDYAKAQYTLTDFGVNFCKLCIID